MLTNKKLQVLVVADWDVGGGVLSVIGDLAEELAQEVTYSAFFFNGPSGRSPWSSFCDNVFYNSRISLTELLVGRRFHLVHVIDTAYPPPYDVGRWLRRARYRGSVLCNFHVCAAVVPSDQMAHAFVACSNTAARAAKQVIERPVRVIWNGVNEKTFHAQPVEAPARPVLAWVGRAHDVARKDVIGFLHIAASLKDSTYDFWVASPGGLPDDIRVREWFGDRIRIVQDLKRPQMPAFYSAVAASGGAVVSTSASESFQLTLLEAAACGCPIVAPDAAWSAYLQHGESALLYKLEHGVDTARACIQTLNDPAVRTKLIAGAQARIRETFNSRRMAAEYHQAYLDAIRAAQVERDRDWSDSLWACAMTGALRTRRIFRRLTNATI